MQASKAIPVSSRHAPAASAKPFGRHAEVAAAQHAVPPAQVQQAAGLGAAQAEEGLLSASTAMPACVQSAAGLALAQGQQIEGAQGHLEGAATEDAWQIPYNHTVYADEGLHHPSASSTAVHTVLDVGTTPRTTPDGCTPAAVSTAPGYQFPATCESPDVARMSNVGLQKQYDTLLTDLAAQQQQQHLQLPAMRRSRLLDQHPPAASATEVDPGTQAVSSSSSTHVSDGTSIAQSVQAEAARADASTSPMTATARSGTYPASQMVVLPDDPFNQQLPQHLQDLNQIPEQVPKHLLELDQLLQQLPQEQSWPQQWKLEHASEPSQLHNASPQNPAASQPLYVQTASVSSAQVTQHVPSVASAQQPSMSQQLQASAEGQFRPVAELPHSGAESALSSAVASSAIPGTDLQASAMEDPADSASHQAQDSQGTPGDAQQPPDKRLLRASLAEWLADAVASKLWSAFEKQRQAAASVGAPGNSGSSCLLQLPGKSMFHAVPPMSCRWRHQSTLLSKA